MSPTPRKVRVVGDPVLSTPTAQVTDFGDELSALIDDMFATMYLAEGVGLAATQIGVGLSVFVYDCPETEVDPVTGALTPIAEHHVGHVVNPVIATTSGPMDESEEGCLSVPGPFHELARPSTVTVRGFDKTGAAIEVTGHGFFARCLLHETEHLSGTLYIDHLPRNRRRKVLREIEPFEWNG